MNNADRQLRDRIVSDAHHNLSDDFSNRVIRSLQAKRRLGEYGCTQQLGLRGLIRRYQLLVLVGLIVGAVAAHQGYQNTVDEELLQVDVLSMSSASVL